MEGRVSAFTDTELGGNEEEDADIADPVTAEGDEEEDVAGGVPSDRRTWFKAGAVPGTTLAARLKRACSTVACMAFLSNSNNIARKWAGT